MSKLVAALSFVAVLMLTGCFAPDSGSDDAAGSGGDSTSGSSDQGGDGSTSSDGSGTGGDQGGSDGNSSDGGGSDGGGSDGGDQGDDGSGDAPAPAAGPCDAVVPYDEVSGLIPEPAAGAMSNGGDVITQCEWVSADGNQSLVVSARDAALIGATGIDKAYKKTIKNLGEEAGSRIKTGNASVQVYAMVKGSGKAQPVLYTVTWKGEDVETAALVKIAKRIV